MIEAIGLTKVYGSPRARRGRNSASPPYAGGGGGGPHGLTAVDNLTLTVPAGELFGFLGPNGAGKTTTIKMLVGLLTPTAGHARVAGFDLQAQPAQAKARIGYVPDNPFLYDKLTGHEFLSFIGDLYGLPAAGRAEKAARLLRLLDLDAHADRLIGGYSRGMRQKTALAAALLHDPAALFLDEPTVGLDPGSTRRLKDILRALCREQGVAVFLSTHTLEVAAEICDRVGIFHRGRLIALEAPAALSAQAASGRLEDVFLALTAPESK